MNTEDVLQARSGSKCELCNATDALSIYEVRPQTGGGADGCVLICHTCNDQISNSEPMDVHHWRCLNETMWNQIPAVQVMAWRMLKRLAAEAWARDLLDMLYLDEETLGWAMAVEDEGPGEETIKHLDANGALLDGGDTVTLIKDLNVKGAGFTAKRGTSVRNISLVPDNSAQIEGRVNGQQIVILTEFVKKSG